MKWNDGQRECVYSVLCNGHERVQKPPSYHHEELACSDLVVVWVGLSNGVNVCFVCVLLAVFVCYASIPLSALLSSLLLILWISWMCSVAALHGLSVPCTLCIHWLALTMKQSVYLLCVWFDNV